MICKYLKYFSAFFGNFLAINRGKWSTNTFFVKLLILAAHHQKGRRCRRRRSWSPSPSSTQPRSTTRSRSSPASLLNTGRPRKRKKPRIWCLEVEDSHQQRDLLEVSRAAVEKEGAENNTKNPLLFRKAVAVL